MSQTRSHPVSPSRLHLPAKLCIKTTNDIRTIPVKALIDSGADNSFMDFTFAQQSGLQTVPLECPLVAKVLDGRHLAQITHETKPVEFIISGNRHEKVSFKLISSPHPPIILGLPWLKLHNPHLDWSSCSVLSWSVQCHSSCLFSAVSPTEPLSCLPDPPDLSLFFAAYHDLGEVFCKHQALSLPPHRPYDCAIDLLPGASFPSSRLNNLSQPEQDTMEKYISDSLAAGIIRPSSSPVGAGFFFVTKKDQTLRPCIDYRGLNNITIKNKYPLPLPSSAFEALHGAKIFTKLDLRNAYHLVCIRNGDEWKTAFNTPLGHFEYLLMPFGLTNAPAVFQALVNEVLRDFLDRFVFVYLDDILIF